MPCSLLFSVIVEGDGSARQNNRTGGCCSSVLMCPRFILASLCCSVCVTRGYTRFHRMSTKRQQIFLPSGLWLLTGPSIWLLVIRRMLPQPHPCICHTSTYVYVTHRHMSDRNKHHGRYMYSYVYIMSGISDIKIYFGHFSHVNYVYICTFMYT